MSTVDPATATLPPGIGPMPPPAPVVEIEGLTKAYEDLQRGPVIALDGLTLVAQPGEIVGLLGPNGAGKTTALRILSTLLKPTAGSARVNGFDCQTQPELVRRQIGLVSQSTAVYDRMTAREFVAYFGALHGLEERELNKRIDWLFEQLDMTAMSDVLGAKMSTGMKQKTSIARALVHDPPVLIFDEATNGLDVLAARTLLDTVAQLRQAGKCLIFSTHIMREVERLCDRLVILHRGRVLTQGGLAELRGRHGEEDLEELFFQLIRQADNQNSQPPTANGQQPQE